MLIEVVAQTYRERLPEPGHGIAGVQAEGIGDIADVPGLGAVFGGPARHLCGLADAGDRVIDHDGAGDAVKKR